MDGSDPEHGAPPVFLRLLSHAPCVEAGSEVRKGRILALLTYLHLGPSSTTRDELLDLLWDPEPGRAARHHRLRELLSAVRRLLRPGALLTEGRSVGLAYGAVGSDVEDFRRAVADGRLADAAELAEGGFLQGPLPVGATLFEEWASEYGRALGHELEAVLDQLVERCEAAGDLDQAARWAERLWTLAPDDEHRAERLLRLARVAGDCAARLALATRVEAHFRDGAPALPERVAALLDEARARLPEAEEGVEASPGSAAEAEAEDTAEAASEPPAEPPVQPAAGAERRWDGSHRRRRLGALLGLAVVGAGLAALALVAMDGATPPGAPPAPAFGGGGTLLYHDAQRRMRALRFTGPLATDTVEVEVPAGWDQASHVVLSPVNGTWAYPCTPGPSDNREICLHDPRLGRDTVVSPSPGEDAPIGWSPDGAWLLFKSDRTARAGVFDDDVFAVHVASGELRRITDDPHESAAAWSPDGTHLLVKMRLPGGDSLDVVTVDASVTASHRFAGRTETYWSRDGRQILILETRSRAERASTLFVWRPPEAPLTMDVPLSTVERALWSPDGTRLLLSGLDGRRRKVLVCAHDACGAAELEMEAGSRLAVWTGDRAPPYLDRVEITAERTALRVGDTCAISVRTLDAEGAPFEARSLALRALDPQVGWLDSASTFHAIRAGTARVEASAGGWRADTLEILVRPAPAPALLLEETWDGGIDPERWKPFGMPLPEVVRQAGEGRLRSNGDSLFPSGLVSRRPIDLSDGITLEWTQSTPLTGEFWQEVWLEFSLGPLEAFRAEPGVPYPETSMRLQVAAPILYYQPPVPKLTLLCGLASETIETYPPPLAEGGWHAFVFQFQPERGCALFIDGRLFLSLAAAPFDTEPDYFFWLGGRSVRTSVLLDDVRLWRGLRWVADAEGRAVAR